MLIILLQYSTGSERFVLRLSFVAKSINYLVAVLQYDYNNLDQVAIDYISFPIVGIIRNLSRTSVTGRRSYKNRDMHALYRILFCVKNKSKLLKTFKLLLELDEIYISFLRRPRERWISVRSFIFRTPIRIYLTVIAVIVFSRVFSISELTVFRFYYV